ncbi:TolC family protein [Chryseosolibacter indicus]|uniref:TolC family protein n=1 Tax=Chryseosolibacter indicus TaxID=2782351 RepID=A0ABS5VLA5_9BACT|nr:TolC family protein [Chryseosolibacter indicus]MBT1701891.1 TolC family protein [Chryseosolibacter indicus]
MVVLRIFSLLLISYATLYGQDTLRVTLPEADSLLITRNLSLIAFHYEIDKAEAGRIQARLFNNPELSTEWNLYNPSAPKWFDVGNRGQKIVGLQQIFRIAGQRNTAIKLAEEEKRMTQSQYKELVRSLRYELHVSFYRYHFLRKAIANINSQLVLLKNLTDVYGDQYKKGNVSLQELTRLNTTYFTINNQVNDIRRETMQLQSTLKILLAEERVVLPMASDDVSYPLPAINEQDLVNRALDNRPEIKTIQSMETQNELRYRLAKKEAMPDLAAGVLYDQAGSYVNNYTALTVRFNIPIFNRNQGQIQSAKIGIQQSKVLLQSKQQQIRSEVQNAWNVLRLLLDQYNAVSKDFESELNLLSEGLVNNYSKNNISLLEFTDLFESYNTNIIQYNQLKADLNKSYEELTYAVGEDIVQ